MKFQSYTGSKRAQGLKSLNCNIIFVVLTSFHLTFFWIGKIQRVKTKRLMKICHFGAGFFLSLCFNKEVRWTFLLQKIRQIKAGQNIKYDISTKTSGLVQIWQAIF